LFPRETEESDVKILHDLMDSKHNLNMKTRIANPVAMAVFDVYAIHYRNYTIKETDEKGKVKYKKINLKKTYAVISGFSEYFKEFMVDYPDGEGRKEICNAIAGIREQEKNVSFTEKLLGGV
jgi:L-ribulose-5-phosphate 3-epimerase UlaE